MNGSWAYCVGEDGSAAPVTLDHARAGCGDAPLAWLHLDGQESSCIEWLRSESRLPEQVVDALLAVETRPRATELAGGVIVNFRGVNMQPGADPDDLVSIRVWAEAGRVISVSFRPLMALPDLRRKIEEGRILDPGDFIAVLAAVMTERLEPVVSDLGDSVDTLEEQLGDKNRWAQVATEIGDARRAAIELRRFVAPQKEALIRLITGQLPWLTDDDRTHLREAADHVARMAEELDSIRDRAAVLRDELSDRAAERTNQRSLVLSIMAAIYLPLTFITGLLGMNVAGIPFAEEPWAFTAVVLLNLGFAASLLAWFKFRGWF